jgi:putative flavoprotein involved in K+ transport
MRTTTVIIGAGHAGLAMSRRLADRSIDHVVLERGEVANSWKTERWPSLRLQTPNWQTRLPGARYEGDDPDGFMSMPELIGFLRDYAEKVSAPVRTNTTVTSVRATDSGYEVVTDDGSWSCKTVVLASGACNLPVVPKVAEGVPSRITALTAMDYRSADELPEGGVLVVGGSATGVQFADEIRRSGRPVTLAVGEHVRLPRLYRGRDIFWWMDAAGVLDERYDEVDDVTRARHVPSPQLIGTPERETIDINTLNARGVRVVGRLGRVQSGVAQFSGSLANQGTLADLKMNRLLATIDDWSTRAGIDDDVDPPHRFEPTRTEAAPTLAVDLSRGEISTVIWACGYKADYSWLDLPVLDGHQRIRHEGGVVADAPGVYLLGTKFLRRRRSTFINGAEHDTLELSDHLVRFLTATTSRYSLGTRSASVDVFAASARPRSSSSNALPASSSRLANAFSVGP